MHDLVLRRYIAHTFDTRPYDDRGEGVISTAIAVLIMAFLGVAVWVGFKATLDSTQDRVDDTVEQIGR